jgi:hypothetical protein
MRLEDLPPEARAELEELGERVAARLEATADERHWVEAELPPELALKQLRFKQAMAARDAQKEMANAVARARREGVSWNKVGAALGITGETARQRYRVA